MQFVCRKPVGQSGRVRYTPPMQKWEYKVVKRADVSEEILNTLGSDGWELMNFVLPHANIPGSFDEIEVEIVLRRPVTS